MDRARFGQRLVLHCVVRASGYLQKNGTCICRSSSQTLKLSRFFCFFATSRRPSEALSTKFERVVRFVISVSDSICLQHVDRDAQRRAAATAETCRYSVMWSVEADSAVKSMTESRHFTEIETSNLRRLRLGEEKKTERKKKRER